MIGMFNPHFVDKVWAKRRAERNSCTVADWRRRRLEERARRALAEAAAIAARSVPAPDHPHRQPVKEIIAEIAERYQVPADAITGASRSRWLVPIRHLAMVEVYKRRPDLSLTQIGKAFGGRDHTTVLYALRKAGILKRGVP